MSIERARPVNPIAVLIVISLGLFMTLLDLTIVNIAIPNIVDGIHASLDQVLWVLNAYSLVYAVLLITSGRLGDIFGPRNLFAVGIVVFTLASVASGLAQDPTQLILGRPRVWAPLCWHRRACRFFSAFFLRSAEPPPSPSSASWPGWQWSPGPRWVASSSPTSAGAGSST